MSSLGSRDRHLYSDVSFIFHTLTGSGALLKLFQSLLFRIVCLKLNCMRL